MNTWKHLNCHYFPNSYKQFNKIKLDSHIFSQKQDINTNTLSETLTHRHCISIDDCMMISHDKSLVQILNWTVTETDAQLILLIRFLRYLVQIILFYIIGDFSYYIDINWPRPLTLTFDLDLDLYFLRKNFTFLWSHVTQNDESYVRTETTVPIGISSRNNLQPTRSFYDFRFQSYGWKGDFHGCRCVWPWPWHFEVILFCVNSTCSRAWLV